METFLEDILEQLSISRILLDSKNDTDRRLSFIITDNTIEYMLKVYGETKLVGLEISKRNWDNIRNSFKALLEFIADKSKFPIDEQTIRRYHLTRNELYHKVLPLSIEPRKASDYIDLALSLLQKLFNVNEKSLVDQFEMTRKRLFKTQKHAIT